MARGGLGVGEQRGQGGVTAARGGGDELDEADGAEAPRERGGGVVVIGDERGGPGAVGAEQRGESRGAGRMEREVPGGEVIWAGETIAAGEAVIGG